jgi:antitoxin (DNA-binding transcriptional repressor) of toxin-antitoxin stability system
VSEQRTGSAGVDRLTSNRVWYILVRRRTIQVVATMTASEARAALPEILDRVGDGEEVVITRHGRPVAVVLRPDALRSRRADAALRTADEVRAALATGREAAIAPRSGLSIERAGELVRTIQAGRKQR